MGLSHVSDRLAGGEGIAELLFFLCGPSTACLGLVGINDTGCACPSGLFEGFQGQIEGADGIGLLVRAVRRELLAGGRIPAVGE